MALFFQARKGHVRAPGRLLLATPQTPHDVCPCEDDDESCHDFLPRHLGALSEPEKAAALIDEKGGDVGEHGHVGEKKYRPFPRAGLSFYDGDGAHALAGE